MSRLNSLRQPNRHYGLMTAATTQWFWNFVVSCITPTMVLKLPQGAIVRISYCLPCFRNRILTRVPQLFFFAAFNIISFTPAFFFPETNGLSLESMDVLFGSVTKE